MGRTRHSEYQLKCGREVVLRDLRQWRTDEGVIEGRRPPHRNGKLLADLFERVRDEAIGVSMYLGNVECGERTDAAPFGTPRDLPRVSCRARFVSYEPARERDKMCSEVTLIWFQDDFGIQGELDDALADVDWNACAWDYDL